MKINCSNTILQLTVYHHNGGPCYRCLFPTPPPAAACQRCSDSGVLGVGKLILYAVRWLILIYQVIIQDSSRYKHESNQVWNLVQCYLMMHVLFCTWLSCIHKIQRVIVKFFHDMLIFGNFFKLALWPICWVSKMNTNLLPCPSRLLSCAGELWLACSLCMILNCVKMVDYSCLPAVLLEQMGGTKIFKTVGLGQYEQCSSG